MCGYFTLGEKCVGTSRSVKNEKTSRLVKNVRALHAQLGLPSRQLSSGQRGPCVVTRLGWATEIAPSARNPRTRRLDRGGAIATGLNLRSASTKAGTPPPPSSTLNPLTNRLLRYPFCVKLLRAKGANVVCLYKYKRCTNTKIHVVYAIFEAQYLVILYTVDIFTSY